MTKYISLFLLLCGNVVQTLYAQNLVPNGGFEEAIECPETLDALHFGCADWYKSIQIPGNEMHENPSPDWYHGCSDNPVFIPPDVITGYQNPNEGNSYAGIITFGISSSNYREFIGVQLTESLTQGEFYTCSFHLNRAHQEQGPFSSGFATNCGVIFTTNELFIDNQEVFSVTPHFEVDSVVTDSLDWLSVTFTFQADSNYHYLHIGNFSDDDSDFIADIEYNPEGILAYYYIDNVSVELANPDSYGSVKRSSAEFYPNPTNGRLTIEFNKMLVDCTISNCLGVELKVNFVKIGSDYVIDISDLKSGVYLLIIQDDEGTYYSERIILQK